MSHILDALRKAQDETTGTSRTPSVAGGDTLIARRGTARWGGMTTRVWSMIGAGIVLLVVVGWFLYGPSRKSAQRPAVEQVAAPAPPMPSLPPPVSPPAVAPVPVSPVPAPAATPAAQPPAASTPAAAAPAVSDSGDGEEEEAPRRRGRRGRTMPAPESAPAAAAQPEAPQAATPASAPVVAGAPEGVKLTGIAWQENRKLRRAVINDVLVGEGVLVAGAKVVEIRPTAVRFEKNGSVFEVPLLR